MERSIYRRNGSQAVHSPHSHSGDWVSQPMNGSHSPPSIMRPSSERHLSAIWAVHLIKAKQFYIGHSKSNTFYLFLWKVQRIQEQVLMNVSECLFFPHRGIQCHTFASCALWHQMPFCQCPSAPQQQNVMQHWWEGSISASIPPTSAPMLWANIIP